MDKQTLSNYGWIVVMVLTLAVIIAAATPFGEYVGDAITKYALSFKEVLQKTTDEVDENSEKNDILLNGSYVITDIEGTDYPVYKVNSQYDGYALTSSGTIPALQEQYFRCVRYPNIEERSEIKELFYLADIYCLDDTLEERQGIQYLLLHYITGEDYSEKATSISSTARTVYDTLLSKKGTLSYNTYKNITLVSIEKNNLIDVIFYEKEIPIGSPGLYDANGVMLASWTQLVNAYGLDVETDYGNVIGVDGTLYSIMNNNTELSSGAKLIVSDEVTKIGSGAFLSTALTTIELPDTTDSIGMQAFRGCSNLTSITLPNTISNIDYCAFMECASLTSITLPSGLNEVSTMLFKDCDSLLEVVLPDGIAIIDFSAFHSCDSLKTINIPNSVTTLAGSAFKACTSLTSIAIPNSVTSIGTTAFSGCTNLATITIPSSVTDFGSQVFKDTAWLSARQSENPLVVVNNILVDGTACSGNAIIPNTVVSICGYAFSECADVKSITIPNSITNINSYTFNKCTNLITVSLPDTITKIGSYAFYNCNSLSSIELPENITSIENYTFYNCDSLTSINIPDNVTSIGDYAFSSCDGFTSIIVPNNVTMIGKYTFDNCASLTSATIGNKVSTIDEYAFSYCKALTTVTIPNSVTTIEKGVFNYCTSLETVYFNGTQAEWDAITIGANNEYLTEANIVFTMDMQLATPVISVADRIVTITSVTKATSYEVYVNNTLITTTTELTVDLTSTIMSDGTYTIGVKAIADGYTSSELATAKYTYEENGVIDSEDSGESGSSGDWGSEF